MLSKDAILSGLRSLPTQEVVIPELGGSVRVRTLTGDERDAWEESLLDENKKLSFRNARARFVSLAVVDDAGNRLFNDLEAQELGRGNGVILDRLYLAARKLNVMTKQDEDELKAALKNGQSGGPGSGSPNNSIAA